MFIQNDYDNSVKLKFNKMNELYRMFSLDFYALLLNNYLFSKMYFFIKVFQIFQIKTTSTFDWKSSLNFISIFNIPIMF